MFWFGLNKCQVPIKAVLSLSLLNSTGERKYDERLEGGDKDRERSLINYHHGQNRLNLGGKGSLICHQTNQSSIMKNLKTPFPHLSLLPRLSFNPIFLPPPPEQRRRMGNGGCSQFITRCLCRSFLLRGRTPHTLPLLQREFPLTGDSIPLTSPA